LLIRDVFGLEHADETKFSTQREREREGEIIVLKTLPPLPPGGILPAWTLDVFNFLISKLKPPNLVNFPKIYLRTI